MSFSEVEFFTMELREMTGQKFAICPNISSSMEAFWWADLRDSTGMDCGSSEKPRSGSDFDFFAHEQSSPKKGAKFESKVSV